MTAPTARFVTGATSDPTLSRTTATGSRRPGGGQAGRINPRRDKIEFLVDDPATPPAARLIYAVLLCGLEDAAAGDRFACNWLKSRVFDYYCSWLDIDPDYMRRRMRPLMPDWWTP